MILMMRSNQTIVWTNRLGKLVKTKAFDLYSKDRCSSTGKIRKNLEIVFAAADLTLKHSAQYVSVIA